MFQPEFNIEQRKSVAIIAPRHRLPDIRASNKIGCTLKDMGLNVTLVFNSTKKTHKDMKVVTVDAPYNGIWRFLTNTPSLFMQSLRLKSDLYILVNPDCLLLAFMLILCGKKVIYDTHEDFLYRTRLTNIIPSYLKNSYGYMICALEWFLSYFAHGFVVTQDNLVRRYGKHCLLLANAPRLNGSENAKANATQRLKNSNKPFELIYAGIIAPERNPLLMLDIIHEINRHMPCRLKLIGQFNSEALMRSCSTHVAWSHVDYLTQMPQEEALVHIVQADIGLAILQAAGDIPNSGITKIYEYMQFGVPFVASDFDYWQKSVKGTEAGLFLPPCDPQHIAKEIIDLWHDKSRFESFQLAGPHFIQSDYNWENHFKPLKNLITQLIFDKRTVYERRGVPTNRSHHIRRHSSPEDR